MKQLRIINNNAISANKNFEAASTALPAQTEGQGRQLFCGVNNISKYIKKAKTLVTENIMAERARY